MPLASTSRLAVRYIQEAVFGTIPGTGVARALRITGESLNYGLKKDWSKEIRQDRNVPDLITVDADVGGSLPFELSYAEYDDFVQAALLGTWAEINAFGSISATITLSNTLTAGAGTPFANLATGMKVRFSGFTNAGNNVTLTIATATSTVLTFSGTPLTNETATVSFTAGGQAKGTATFTTTTVTFAAGSPFANVVAGQWVYINGAVNTVNNGWKQVASATASTLTFAAATFTAETSTAGVTISGARLTNGTTARSFSIEESFGDVTQFVAFRGMNANKMSLDYKVGAILGGSFDFMGKDQLAPTGATSLPASVQASFTNDVMNSVTGVTNVLENGTVLSSTFLRSFSLDVDNNLRGQKGIGQLGNVGIGLGHVAVTGKVEFYFADATIYNKFVNNTQTSLSLRTADSAGNGYVLSFPKVRYSAGDIQAGGIDQDVIVSMGFQAVYDPTTAASILIDRAGPSQAL